MEFLIYYVHFLWKLTMKKGIFFDKINQVFLNGVFVTIEIVKNTFSGIYTARKVSKYRVFLVRFFPYYLYYLFSL